MFTFNIFKRKSVAKPVTKTAWSTMWVDGETRAHMRHGDHWFTTKVNQFGPGQHLLIPTEVAKAGHDAIYLPDGREIVIPIRDMTQLCLEQGPNPEPRCKPEFQDGFPLSLAHKARELSIFCCCGEMIMEFVSVEEGYKFSMRPKSQAEKIRDANDELRLRHWAKENPDAVARAEERMRNMRKPYHRKLA